MKKATPDGRVALECSALCDRRAGTARSEDQFLTAELARSVLVHQTSLPHCDHSRIVGRSQGTLLVVATGAGASGAGAVASTVAVDAVTSYVLNAMPWLCRLGTPGADDVLDALDVALVRCRTAVRAARGDGDDADAGFSLTMAYVIGSRGYVVHIGATSAYHWRPPALRPITRSLAGPAAELRPGLEPGGDTQPAWGRRLWPAANGRRGPREPEVVRVDLEPGDALLVCSPGLTRSVPDARIVDELAVPLPVGRGAELCRRLVARAQVSGANDDVTVVVARSQPARERRRSARVTP